jgi:hypothetical protein
MGSQRSADRNLFETMNLLRPLRNSAETVNLLSIGQSILDDQDREMPGSREHNL